MKKLFILFITIFSVFAANYALAAPNIFSTSGVFNDGQTITVSGSGFGSDVDVSKIHWLKPNIEASTATDESVLFGGSNALSGWYAWPSVPPNLSPVYDMAQYHSGTKSMRFSARGSGIQASQIHYQASTAIQSGLIIAWRRWNLNHHLLTYYQQKHFRFSHNGFLGSELFAWQPAVLLDFTGTSGGCTPGIVCAVNLTSEFIYHNGLNGGETWASPSTWVQPMNTWARWESYAQMSSAPGINDGFGYEKEIELGVGVHNWATNNNAITYDATAPNTWIYVNLGIYLSNFTPGGVESADDDVWYDSIYLSLDNKQARVELCDTSAWSARTHCEVQIPTSWADGAITLTGNQGSFTTGQTAYLYAVDSGGNVNANGYAVTLGSSQPPDTTPPAAPTGVTVS